MWIWSVVHELAVLGARRRTVTEDLGRRLLKQLMVINLAVSLSGLFVPSGNCLTVERIFVCSTLNWKNLATPLGIKLRKSLKKN